MQRVPGAAPSLGGQEGVGIHCGGEVWSGEVVW